MSRILSVFLLAAVLLLPFSTDLRADQYFELTPSQKHFTSIIQQLPSVVSTEWRTPVSLWVHASSSGVGSPPSSEKAESLAQLIADRGRTAMYQPFCVHVYRSAGAELGKRCVY